jgi:GntP family gluconate:H+ symporter
MATVLATSLYSVHCLIPPHPGALAAAGIFGVNAGNLIVAGIILAVPGALSAWFWSRRLTAKVRYSEPDPAGEEEFPLYDRKLPSPFMSFLPVVVPLLLITAKSLAGLFDEDGSGLAARVLRFPGEPVFALFAGVLLSLLLVPQKSLGVFNEYFSEAINKAGPILIVTAAGGMFGMVIKSTGVGEAAGQVLAGTGLGLFVPFLIAVILKTAQGSSTVAIITTAALVMPMAGMLGLDSERGRLLTLLAMGAGSMMISHANDSYFWVVSNFSGIDMETTLKIYSTSTIVMGITVFIFVFLASLIVL